MPASAPTTIAVIIMRSRRSARTRGVAVGLATLVLALLVGPVAALAERPATRTEYTAINRLLASSEASLHTRLDWVKVSTRGPFALAYLSGPGQVSAIVLQGSGRHWRSLAAISDEGLRCGLVPPPVVADLHLERYNEGPHPCEP
jgi:hypothetical protein